MSEILQNFPSPRNPRYKSLDFWRGVACLTVVIYHSSFYAQISDKFTQTLYKGIITHFRLGVAVFFVISGYCIAAASDSTRRRPHSVRQYFGRRFRRIFPPYWILVVVSVVIVGLFSYAGYGYMFADYDNHPIELPATLSLTQWIGNITLIEEWRYHIFGSEQLYFQGHAWSLCYEEQFYAVCGLILFLAPKRFFQGILFVSAAVFVLAAFKNYLPISGFFFDGSWLVFAFGVLVYYRLNYAEGKWAKVIDVSFIFFAIFALVVLLRRYDRLSKDCFVGAMFALIIILLHRYDTKISNSKILSPITFCGTMCYSLYLVHWMVVKLVSKLFAVWGYTDGYFTLFVTIPVCVAFAVWVSWYFHIYVERRFLNQPLAEKIDDSRVKAKQLEISKSPA